MLGWLHKPTNQTSQATMDSVWMKNASSPFTYSSRRKIFLQGCPLEMWHSHGMRPAATLPTRFSIKQANNKIPTPINKWSFLNKVVYTEPLTVATHHNLMASCDGQSYTSPSHLYLLAEMGVFNPEQHMSQYYRRRHDFTWLSAAISVWWLIRILKCVFRHLLLLLPSVAEWINNKDAHTSTQTPSVSQFFSPLLTAHRSLSIQNAGLPDACVSVNANAIVS